MGMHDAMTTTSASMLQSSVLSIMPRIYDSLRSTYLVQITSSQVPSRVESKISFDG